MTLHVFNVAGILLNGRDDAIERSLRKRMAPDVIETWAPIPRAAANDSAETVLARTGEAIDRFLAKAGTATTVGIGRSFGGYVLLAAVAAEPRRIAAFSLLVAIEAPLAADADVKIPPLLPVLRPARRHYDERREHAARMTARLAGASNIVTIGSAVDSVIAPASHRMTGGAATHVELPPFAPALAPETALLPRSYRAHLTWSEAKHDAVVSIIRQSLVTQPTLRSFMNAPAP